MLLIETIFDTLNAKAALVRDRGGLRRRAFPPAGDDLRHDHRSLRPPLCPARRRKPSGIRCAMHRLSDDRLSTARSARKMRAHIADIGRVADTLVCAYPNAGLPNEFGAYDESPEFMAGARRRVRCKPVSSTSSAAAAAPRRRTSSAIAEACAPHRRARHSGAVSPRLRLSGLEPFDADADHIPFVNVGERTNVTGSAKFRKLITRRLCRGARSRARAGRERRADHRRQHGRRPTRQREGDDHVPAT
jgi:5-methyltetrahydrofolate--homocysteine methyltransferase